MTISNVQTGIRSHKRTQGRLDIRLHATIQTLGGTYSAILENISKNGAKLSVQGGLAKGSQVVLKWHGHEAFGAVSWVTSTHYGVALNVKVSEPILRATLALDETCRVPNGDDARLAAREWAEGSARFGFD